MIKIIIQFCIFKDSVFQIPRLSTMVFVFITFQVLEKPQLFLGLSKAAWTLWISVWEKTNYWHLIGMLPTRRECRGSATDRHGFVISSNTDGAMYVKPYNNTAAIKSREYIKTELLPRMRANAQLDGHPHHNQAQRQQPISAVGSETPTMFGWTS